jgi:hypothetical protein
MSQANTVGLNTIHKREWQMSNFHEITSKVIATINSIKKKDSNNMIHIWSHVLQLLLSYRFHNSSLMFTKCRVKSASEMIWNKHKWICRLK